LSDPDRPGALAAAGVIRLGIHGSAQLATSIVTGAGYRLDEVEFRQYDVADPFAPLREGEQDVMIVKYGLREPDLACSEPVAFDGRAVVVGADHPLAGRDLVSIEEIADYEGFRCPGVFPAYVWDQVVPPVTPGGRPVRRVHELTTVPAMVGVLATSSAVHLSFQSLAAVVPAHIRVIPVRDLPPAPVSLAWRRDEPLPAAVGDLIDAAERAARRGATH
jgi:DNA-binding transcriptional LysR family regulator